MTDETDVTDESGKAAGESGKTDETKEREDMSGTVTMYSTTWCGYCRRLKSQMDREGIAYNEINIEHDPQSAAFVEKANGVTRPFPPSWWSAPPVPRPS